MHDYSRDTFFEGVQQLLPGEFCVYDLRLYTMTRSRYFDLEQEIPRQSSEQDYHAALRSSVRLHLRSDVPVGTCLSGGLDSSTVAALAASDLEEKNVRLTAITAKSELARNDESEYARQVVDHCNLSWRVTKPLYEDFTREVEDMF